MKRGAALPLLILVACHRAPDKPAAPPGEVWIAPGQLDEADPGTEPARAPVATRTAPEIRRVLDEVRKAEADMTAAEHDYKRMKELFALCGGQRDLDASEERYRNAKADLERARARARLLSPGGAPGAPR